MRRRWNSSSFQSLQAVAANEKVCRSGRNVHKASWRIASSGRVPCARRLSDAFLQQRQIDWFACCVATCATQLSAAPTNSPHVPPLSCPVHPNVSGVSAAFVHVPPQPTNGKHAPTNNRVSSLSLRLSFASSALLIHPPLLLENATCSCLSLPLFTP